VIGTDFGWNWLLSERPSIQAGLVHGLAPSVKPHYRLGPRGVEKFEVKYRGLRGSLMVAESTVENQTINRVAGD